MKITIKREEIEALVTEAGRMIRAHAPSAGEIHGKTGQANYVTDMDVAIQRFLMGRLRELYPGCGFYGEEDTEGNDHAFRSGLCFYIDPIDGTTNYIFGYDHSCVSVGAALDGEPVAGFVCDPYTQESYAAVRGEGAFLNGSPLRIPDRPLAEGIVAFGCARYNEADTDALFAISKELYLKSLSLRNGGSAALDLCRIAKGSNVLYLELKLQPYDYAAAGVILEEAGGVIGQTDGSPVTLGAPCSVLAGTRSAVAEAMAVCRKYGH